MLEIEMSTFKAQPMTALRQRIRQDAASWGEIALTIGSLSQILGLPVIVGALVDKWGYPAAAAGYIASVDLAGLCLGSVLTSALATRVNWRHYVGWALTVCVGVNLLCTHAQEFWTLLLLRLAAGIASGCIYSAALALLSGSKDPARQFSLLIFLQVIANAVMLAVFPGIVARWGPPGLFVTISLLLAASLAVLPLLPTTPMPALVSTDSVRRGGVSALAALCLVAVAFFYLTIGSYWTYAERMGIQFGLTPDAVHRLLTVGVLLSAAGCALAFWLSRRVGQSRPLLISLSALAVVLLLHAAVPTPGMYVVALAVVQLCWNFVDIFQLGTLALIDPTGRGAALVPAAQGFALAAGPATGGLVLAWGRGYPGVLIFGGITAALAATAYAIVHAREFPLERSRTRAARGSLT
jgi:MFS family permease